MLKLSNERPLCYGETFLAKSMMLWRERGPSTVSSGPGQCVDAATCGLLFVQGKTMEGMARRHLCSRKSTSAMAMVTIVFEAHISQWGVERPPVSYPPIHFYQNRSPVSPHHLAPAGTQSASEPPAPSSSVPCLNLLSLSNRVTTWPTRTTPPPPSLLFVRTNPANQTHGRGWILDRLAVLSTTC